MLTISQIIAQLESLLKEHRDLPVYIVDYEQGPIEVLYIGYWPADGGLPARVHIDSSEYGAYGR